MKGIYAYVDTMDNSVVYVGKDSNIDRGVRRKAHMAPYRYNVQKINRVLQNNPNRYQYKEIFVFDEISKTELNHLEMQQIALFNPKFNFTKGGDGFQSGEEHPYYGKSLSEERRAKISETLKGKFVSEETKKKISKYRNSTGYFRVHKEKRPSCKQGFMWRYSYYENQKRKYIYSTDLEVLKQKVKAKGLEWYKFEEVLE